MDTLTVLTFYLIERIESEFKKFTGNRRVFAHKVLQQYGIKVSFLNMPEGVVASVDYDDIIRLFEKKPLQLASKMGLRFASIWHNN